MTAVVEGWEDIVPVPQDDGPAPVAAIQYAPECKTTFTVPLL
jgi:hypothetical protein